MTVSEFLERFVFVRRCAGCGELIGYEHRDDAFCTTCRMYFEMAKAEPCKICTRAMAECECMPKRLSRAGMPTLKKLFSYKTAQTKRPESKMLYFLKHNRNRRVSRFVAAQLNMRLGELLSDNELEAKDAVITYIPRTKKAVANYGFDQSELICRELSALSGVELLPLFYREAGGREQKKLNSLERAKNAAKNIHLTEENAKMLRGRAVILFDDIVTSGSSMERALKLLRSKGTKNILGLCIATAE